jgi:WhiB family redox-sensing transcriptional regulator
MSRYVWMDQALCAQADPDQWVETGPGYSTRTPKRICQGCPVRSECEAHAAAIHRFEGLAPNGVWGGRSHRQRTHPQQIGEAA